MTNNQLTRERLEKIKSWPETYGAGSNVMLPAEEAEELARMALAAMDRDKVRNEHAEWSQATFGNVGPVGPLKHLSKEALEAAEQPGDLSEWADMQFLLWDAQRRAGVTDEQITQAMIEKLEVNKQRKWPAPKDGEPRLHIKEQQAPVVEREPIAWLNDAYLARGVVDGEAGSEDAGPGYIPVYREAGPQPAPVVPDDVLEALQKVARIRLDLNDFDGVRRGIADCLCDAEEALIEVVNRRAAMVQELKKSAGTEAICRSNENVQVLHTISPAQSDCCPEQNGVDPEQNNVTPAQDGNYLVIPDGYVMVPKEPTKEMIDAGWLHFMGTKNPSSKGTYKAMLAAAPQEEKIERKK